MHARTLAVRTALSLEMMLETIFDQGRQAGIGLDDNITAMTAVAAIGSALRHMRLATEAHATRAARAALHKNANFICEHTVPFLSKGPLRAISLGKERQNA